MAEFRYTAIDRDGRKISSSIYAISEEAVLDSLSNAGLYVLSIKRASLWATKFSEIFVFKKISRKTLIEFSNNLSIMLKAGIPLTEALRELADAEKEHFFREKLRTITSNIELGGSLSESLEEYKRLFPPVFLNLVKVGEETGRLDQSFKEIAEHLKRMEDLSSAIKRAMIYPTLAITATLGAMLFWLIYVLPKIMQVFKDLKISLPLTTRALMAVSDFTGHYWFLLPLTIVVFYMVIKILKAQEKTKEIVDRLILKIPVISLIIYNKLLALFSEQMRILFVSGITIDRIFDMLIDVMDSMPFKRAISRIKEQVLSGGSIGDGLSSERIFPPLIGRMIKVGESTGNMDEQLKFLSDFYLAKLDDVSQKLSKLIEPVVIGLIGIMFAFIIVGLIGPIYEIVSTLGKT